MKNKFITVSSLDKVFPNEPPKLPQLKYSALRNEVFHFQAACFTTELLSNCRIEVDSPIKDKISVRLVEPLPSYLSEKKGENDKYIIKQKRNSTLYPELLRKMNPRGEYIRKHVWTTFWVTVNTNQETIDAGDYEIKLKLFYDGDKLFKECVFKLTIIDAELPESDLKYTAWIHYDCIARQHDAPMFSPKFYKALNSYITSAISHGLTMLYTPLFTPPLDTAVGHERDTAQLIDIKVLPDNTYKFDFSKLEFFMDNAIALGVKQFEFSHLATQWGAQFCPKIMAEKDGETIKIFGWETSSSGKSYLDFLDSFLSELSKFLDARKQKYPYAFHIADEPGKDHLNNFVNIQQIIIKHFPDAQIMDALCDLDFYKQGIINMPVAATDHADAFIKENCLKWVYYCSWQRKNYLSNRFFNMPSQRNRILGMQLFASGAQGFLHWAFNFYNTALSTRPINPYIVTDAGGGFESGDSFFVYPNGDDGINESLRHEVFYDGLNDYRALMLLSHLTNKNDVLYLLKKQGIDGFFKYKKSAKWHLKFRETINQLISKNS